MKILLDIMTPHSHLWAIDSMSCNSPFCNIRGVQLQMQDCRQWVHSKLEERGTKPFEFVQTVPCYDPTRSVSSSPLAGNSNNFFNRVISVKYSDPKKKIYLCK